MNKQVQFISLLFGLVLFFSRQASAECSLDFQFKTQTKNCEQKELFKIWKKNFYHQLFQNSRVGLRPPSAKIEADLSESEKLFLEGRTEEAAHQAAQVLDDLSTQPLRKNLDEIFRRSLLILAMSEDSPRAHGWTVNLCLYPDWKKHLPQHRTEILCNAESIESLGGPFPYPYVFGRKEFKIPKKGQVVTYLQENAGIQTKVIEFPKNETISSARFSLVDVFKKEYLKKTLQQTRPNSLKSKAFNFSYEIQIPKIIPPKAKGRANALAVARAPTTTTEIEKKDPYSWLKSPWFWVIAAGVVGTGTFLIVDHTTSSPVKVKTP